ncbi:helix-turn-helix transcriptional regulator [Paenibacillus sp. GD4]|jgi:transcriptional regulator with XRE-family HTH domain|uniref:helix-turn-helix domain-containing protein n=1 Tax=Paenibacillus sp. GD4 TaxID=3068890 RepID=UPI0027969166|nr:helix-turn-helix transcriptional regulator [Paenibacillus sp. GD4]MDQ1910423.1 helix-turn-helix transcriptional regulator [Paenibacillus sp. GD4]
MKHLGSRISLLREKYGFTQEDVASRLGISRSSLSHYETDRREPDYDTLKKFADFYRVSVDYLMGRLPGEQQQVAQHVGSFERSLELSDERILQEFTLTVDGRELTREEATRFIAMIRKERQRNQR